MVVLTHKLFEIVKEPGISDLPVKVRGKFALSVKLEREGDSKRAAELLDEAITEEETPSPLPSR